MGWQDAASGAEPEAGSSPAYASGYQDYGLAATGLMEVAQSPTERGCLGCLVDGHDHTCGYVGLAGVFGSKRSRRR